MEDRNRRLSLRLSYAGRTFGISVGRKGLIAAGGAVALIFVLTTQFIYDYRYSRGRLGELWALRQRMSEQNLTLYNLNAKFESLEAEVDRMRALDVRIRSLARANASLGAGGARRDAESGRGGVETPETSATARLDRLLDLRLDRLRKDVLVGVKDLSFVEQSLDSRRVFLESVPSLRPVRGVFSSAFGVRISPFTDTEVFHHGVDIMAPAGTPIQAAAAGRIVRAGYEALVGNCVEIDHGNGYRTLYAHQSQLLVALGDIVARGETIGKVGATGRTTGPHLHYEVHVNGLPVNPSRFMN